MSKESVNSSDTDVVLHESIVAKVPSKTEIAWVCFLSLPVFCVGVLFLVSFAHLFMAQELLGSGYCYTTIGGVVIYCGFFSFSAILIFCSIWFPVQKAKQRRDAICINAWDPAEQPILTSSIQ